MMERMKINLLNLLEKKKRKKREFIDPKVQENIIFHMPVSFRRPVVC